MKKKASIGQSIVEFALILPGMLMLVMGVLEIGRLFYIKVALQNAAREGAYYLSYYPQADTAGILDDFENAVIQEANSAGVALVDDDITMNNCCTTGDYVEVVVKQDHVSLLIFGFLTGEVDLSSKARMMVQ